LNCGLSKGSIFIEGTEKSGSKWQIKFAIEQKKLMFGLIPKDKNRKNSFVPLHIINKLNGYPISTADEVIIKYKKNKNKMSIEKVKKTNNTSILSYFD
ncbi:MAG: hypothetical protein HWN67_20095, partial [Candidatus Helarchaeota archaeon]|nr:hypothetical protein [Candidatus Helarchaeota archaeon]